MKLSIIGTGYVGLVTGVCLAEKGHSVVCVDVDENKVSQINAGKTPIYEPGLRELLRRHVGGRLRANTDLDQAVLQSNLTLIAVGTPFKGNQIDLTYVRNCAAQIGVALRRKKTYHVVVVKSTVVPGTTDDVVSPILEKESGRQLGRDFGVGMNPEFLSEGEAVNDFMQPDRIVLGGMDERTRKSLAKLYRSFRGVPVIRTTNKTAEMIKYTSNALLATLISFSNEIGNLCSNLGGVDCVDVMEGVHLSQYFRGRNKEGLPPITSFLKAGCGFGGSCLPKDVKALIGQGQCAGQSMPLLEAVIRVNEEQPKRVVQLLEKHWPKLADVRIVVLGLSFKPETSDVRESPAFPIMRELLKRGAKLKAYDPVAMPEAQRVFRESGVTFVEDLESALVGIDAAVVVTPWREFDKVPAILAARQPQPVFVDGRRAYNKQVLARYEGVGL